MCLLRPFLEELRQPYRGIGGARAKLAVILDG
jgi:hypothetical protein